jgi:hypothetical protein
MAWMVVTGNRASPHLLKRMIDRRFNEPELRLMLEQATGYHADIDPGRWVIESIHHRGPWEVIVEPDPANQRLIVITAYSVG